MSSKIYFFAAFLLVSNLTASFAQDDNARQRKLKAMQDMQDQNAAKRRSEQTGITSQDIDDAVKKLFGDQVYYSASAYKGGTSFFGKDYTGMIISKMAYYKNDRNFHNVKLGYPKLPKTATQSDLAKTNMFWEDWALPSIEMDEALFTKGNLSYRELIGHEEQRAFAGVIDEKNGSVTVIFVPPVNPDDYAKEMKENVARGYNKAYNLFDYDKICVDMLFKDEATAKNANLDARKQELKALVQKNVKEDDEKRGGATANVKPDPEGMKLPADLHKTMASLAQVGWDHNVCEDPRCNPMGTKGAKLAKIWSISNDWVPEKDDEGILIHDRFIWAEAIFKTSEKCFLYRFKFTEPYMGSGTYSKELSYDVVEISQSSNLKLLKCENAK